MARQLIACLGNLGHTVDVASTLRAFIKKHDDASGLRLLQQQADQEVQRLSQQWAQSGPPSLWFCYHPYYKSPDLIGPVLCARFNVPYITAEASYSARRNEGVWAVLQESVLHTVNQAAVNVCFTQRDKAGLELAAPQATTASLKPFVHVGEPACVLAPASSTQLVTVAMMRRGDKLNSYRHLAAALSQVQNEAWRLSIIGDGPERENVQQLFSRFPDSRITWHGELSQSAINDVYTQSHLYVWPGCGEAYGLAYLEAQAYGLPVVAFHTAGVPEVVQHGHSGLLTTPGDDTAYAAAVQHLLVNETERYAMAHQAMQRVRTAHSFDSASSTLRSLMQQHAGLST